MHLFLPVNVVFTVAARDEEPLYFEKTAEVFGSTCSYYFLRICKGDEAWSWLRAVVD